MGVFLSQLILAEIGDIHRFPSSQKLCSYAGLVPSIHQSRQTFRFGPCSKQGNKFLRWAMVEIAHVAVRKDPHLKSFFSRIKQKKSSQKAIVATARKMLTIVYHMLIKNEPFKFYALPDNPVKVPELRAR